MVNDGAPRTYLRGRGDRDARTDCILNALSVHETAIVESGALIGDGTMIWHDVQVRSGARVGAGCVLGKGVFVDQGVVIGDRVKIQNGVSVYRGVTLGDDVFVGPNATFTNDLRPRAFVSDWEIVPTVVHDGASIGANATIICGAEIGEYAMVGAGAVVTRDVDEHALVVGNPARVVGWVCRCGRLVSREAERPRDLDCGQCAR